MCIKEFGQLFSIYLNLHNIIGDEIFLMWKKKKLIGFIIVLILLGISFDLHSIFYTPIISVSNEFIYYIFAAHSTIAAISATILTVVVNSLSNRYFGFSIKEVTNFKNDYLNISQAIPISLFSILISSGLLSIGFLNSMIVVMICIIVLISNLSEFCWRILSDDEFCEQMVLNHIELSLASDNDDLLMNLISKVFESLNSELEINGFGRVEKHLNLINSMIKVENASTAISELLDRNTRKSFEIATKQIGFIPAIDTILPLYKIVAKDMKYFALQDILINQLEGIEFLNDSELHISSFLEISNGFENNNVLDDNLKILILYKYFQYISNNEVISVFVKNRLLDNLIVHVSTFRWKTTIQYDSVKQKVLLYIFKDYILLNRSIEASKTLLNMILKTLYSEGVSSNEKLFETISLMYLSLYLYSESEVETLSIEHRLRLKELFASYEKDIHTVKISFNSILQEYFSEIAKSLLNISEATYDEFMFLEYFPPQFGAKALVWQKAAGISFAMYNYLLSDFVYQELPFLMISNWNSLEDKKYYLRIMLNFFDPVSRKLKEVNQSRLKQISTLICRNVILNDGNQEYIFENLNKEMCKLEEKEIISDVEGDVSVKRLNELFKERLSSMNKLYGLTNSILLDDVKEVSFRPIIQNIEDCMNEQAIAEIIFRYFEIYLRSQITKVFPAVKLSFDLDGVLELLSVLKSRDFDLRNYTFIDDWAFRKEVRESPEFLELIDRINEIEYINNTLFNSRMFFKSDFLDYNFIVTSYKTELLNDEECSVYVENFKVSEGIYKVDEAYNTKDEAMRIIKSRYRKETIFFKFASRFNEDKGIRIEFTYK
jgi:hypothetical protein